jgi:hypothetical protein
LSADSDEAERQIEDLMYLPVSKVFLEYPSGHAAVLLFLRVVLAETSFVEIPMITYWSSKRFHGLPVEGWWISRLFPHKS